jgi:hypothetical protein
MGRTRKVGDVMNKLRWHLASKDLTDCTKRTLLSRSGRPSRSLPTDILGNSICGRSVPGLALLRLNKKGRTMLRIVSLIGGFDKD